MSHSPLSAFLCSFSTVDAVSIHEPCCSPCRVFYSCSCLLGSKSTHLKHSSCVNIYTSRKNTAKRKNISVWSEGSNRAIVQISELRKNDQCASQLPVLGLCVSFYLFAQSVIGSFFLCKSVTPVPLQSKVTISIFFRRKVCNESLSLLP